MNVSRRHVLRVLGGGLIVAAGAVGTFAATRAPSRAVAPWHDAAHREPDPIRRALSWAILAPNPHNRQPWLVRLDGEQGFTLFADDERRLPHTDPFDRQITIGLGCFLEVARQAAAEDGYRLELIPFPDGEPSPTLDARPVARAALVADDAQPDPLFAHVAHRRSCKEPFDRERAVSPDALIELARASLRPHVEVAATVDAAQVAALRDLAWRAHVVEAETPRTYMESVELMRIGKAEIEANPDGIDLGGPFLETLNLLGMLTREQLADRASDAYAQGMQMYQELFAATPAVVWMKTRGNSRRDQLAAGASWVRLNLATTAMGLALHPVSQSLQEYREMAPLLSELHQRLGAASGERIQMLGRLGYGPSTPPSPRWSLATRLLSA